MAILIGVVTSAFADLLTGEHISDSLACVIVNSTITILILIFLKNKGKKWIIWGIIFGLIMMFSSRVTMML